MNYHEIESSINGLQRAIHTKADAHELANLERTVRHNDDRIRRRETNIDGEIETLRREHANRIDLMQQMIDDLQSSLNETNKQLAILRGS
jgi:Skp family chaperone for outer membrane proteins